MERPVPPGPNFTIDDLLAYIANLLNWLMSQVVSWFQNLLNQFMTWVGNLVNNLTNWLVQFLTQVINWFNQLILQMTETVSVVLQTIQIAVTTLLDQIGDFLAYAVTAVADAIQQMIAELTNVMQGILTQLQQVINQIWDTLVNAITSVLDYVSNLFQVLATNLQALFSSIIDTVVAWVQGAITAIQQFVNAAIEWVVGIFNAAVNGITATVNAVLTAVSNAINDVVNLITAAWEQLVTGANTIIDSINERIGSLNEAFSQAATDIIASLTGIADEQLDGMRVALKNSAEFLEHFVDPDSLLRLKSIAETIASPHSLALHDRMGAFQMWKALQPTDKLQGALFHLAFAIPMMLKVYSGVGDANAAVLLQEFAATYPYNILSPAEVVAAYQRDGIGLGEATTILKRHGYDDAAIRHIIDNGEIAPSPTDTLSFWKRGLLNETQVDGALRRTGLDPAYIPAVKESANIIPPPQDLISMAVREAFSPDIVSRFGLHEQFPEEFAQWAAKQGLSREWALNYWAAHWHLPSAQQGFEMMHRGVIGPDDLDLLLKSLDVMPFWRDKLTQIAFNPFTRVDIRRMHAMGILNEQMVLRAHLDMGYDQEKAAQLTEFVLRLNAHAPGEDDEELGKLSRSAILGFYEDGLLPRERAMQLLVTAGHTPEGANLYLSTIDLTIERRERQAQADTILDLFRAGELTFDDAIDRLNSLGLSTAEVERAVAKLQRALVQTRKLPSQQDGSKMFSEGIITQQDYMDLLHRLGYADKWVRAYVLLAGGKLGGNT